MCFITDGKRYVASSDIKCWKFLAESAVGNGIVSPLFGEDVFEGVKCQWTVGKTKKSEMWLEDKLYRVRYFDTVAKVWKTQIFNEGDLKCYAERQLLDGFEILEENI